MVLRHLNSRLGWIVFLFVPGFVSAQDWTEEQCVNKAKHFLSVALAGKKGVVNDFLPKSVKIEPDRFTLYEGEGPPTHLKVMFDYDQGMQASVRTDNGLITGAFGLRSTLFEFDPRQSLSTQELQEMALKYHKEAGWKETGLSNFHFGVSMDPRVKILHYYPSVEGVPYHWESQVMMELDYATAQFIDGYWPKLPNVTPPTNLTPRITVGQATERAVEFVTRERGVTESSVRWNPLCINRVQEYNDFANLNREDLELQRLGKGKLVYDVFVLEETYRNDRRTRYEVIVDAADGRIVTVGKRTVGVGLGGGKAKSGPFGWDLGDDRVRATAAGRAVFTGPASVDFVRWTHERPLKGRTFLLQFGKVFANATFDKSTGLLAMKSQGRVSWGRPSPELARSLSHEKLK